MPGILAPAIRDLRNTGVWLFNFLDEIDGEGCFGSSVPHEQGDVALARLARANAEGHLNRSERQPPRRFLSRHVIGVSAVS